jgi:hypothetical protein
VVAQQANLDEVVDICCESNDYEIDCFDFCVIAGRDNYILRDRLPLPTTSSPHSACDCRGAKNCVILFTLTRIHSCVLLVD